MNAFATLPGRLGLGLFFVLFGLLVQLLMAAIALFMTIWGIKLCAATWNQFMSTLPTLRVGISYSPIPIGGFITLIFVLERLFLGDQSHRRVVNFELVEDSKEAL